MDSEIVIGFASDMMDDVDFEVDTSSCYYIVNGYEPSFSSLISSTDSTEEPVDNAIENYQCNESDDEAFLECQVYGSFYEPGTYCPMLCEFPIAEE